MSREISPISIGMVNHECHPDLVRLSLESVYRRTENLAEVIIVDNGSTGARLIALRELVAELPKARLIERQQTKPGASWGQAEGLDLLLSEFRTEYAAFVENDGFLLSDSWDRRLIDYLLDSGKIIIGCEHPGKAPETVTESFTTFSVFQVDALRSADLSFMPNGDGVSFEPGADTGWQLRTKIEENKAAKLPFRSRRLGTNRVFTEVSAGEYDFGEDLIFAHFGRGSTTRERSTASDLLKRAVRRLRSPSSKRHRQGEISAWIATCESLLCSKDSQITHRGPR
jgi:glycosyltransferase involved in cell wall biosynthesis